MPGSLGEDGETDLDQAPRPVLTHQCSPNDSVLLLTKVASQENGGQQKAMVIRKVCPQCTSSRFKKNGHIHNNKQNHYCHDCGRQFVQYCEQYLISEEKRGLIERLLMERTSLRGICRQ
jgi:transposase-like protein